MAKTTASKTNGSAPKKTPAPRKKATTSKTNSAPAVDKVCADALARLRELNLDVQLQSEIEWCLGSYANDGNPVGLYEMAERALNDFNSVIADQPKAIPAKQLTELKKVVKEGAAR